MESQNFGIQDLFLTLYLLISIRIFKSNLVFGPGRDGTWKTKSEESNVRIRWSSDGSSCVWSSPGWYNVSSAWSTDAWTGTC